MILSADSHPYHIRKELKLPKSECVLIMHAERQHFGWPFGAEAPNMAFDYDPKTAMLKWKPREYFHVMFSFIPSNVAGKPPRFLKLAAYLPNGTLMVRKLKREKNAEGIPTGEIRAALEDIEYEYEEAEKGGNKLPAWMR